MPSRLNCIPSTIGLDFAIELAVTSSWISRKPLPNYQAYRQKAAESAACVAICSHMRPDTSGSPLLIS